MHSTLLRLEPILARLKVSQKTIGCVSINKGIMTLHVVWTALGTRVFPTYFKVAQAHFSPPLLHAITI